MIDNTCIVYKTLSSNEYIKQALDSCLIAKQEYINNKNKDITEKSTSIKRKNYCLNLPINIREHQLEMRNTKDIM